MCDRRCDCQSRKKKCSKKYETSCKPLKCVCVPTFDEQLAVYGRIIAQKILNSIPLAVSDFPPAGVQALTAVQKETLRRAETEGMKCCLGKHAGWKLGLAAATPSTPALGYTSPVFGELLQKMILKGYTATMPYNAGLTVAIECDMLFLVDSDLINTATTPADVLKYVKGVYPAVEYAVVGTSTVAEASGPAAPLVPGQLNGQGILEVTNMAGRAFLRGCNLINIQNSSRSLATWETVLNGGVVANETLNLTTGPAIVGSVPPPATPHLTNLVNLIAKVNASGNRIKKGDLVSPGTAIATRFLNIANPPTSYNCVYTNLDPAGPVQMGLTFSPNGKCFGC